MTSDQDFSDEEVDAIHEICRHLGIKGLDPLALGGMRSTKVH